ncbi:MAG: hypothetical protein AAFW84_26645 [Cyanobacteria bacterium J06635_15]
MARPGGNPNIKEHGFKQQYDWPEPCDQPMTIRMPLSMKQAIKNGEIQNWQEFVRRAIALELGWELGGEVNAESTD